MPAGEAEAVEVHDVHGALRGERAALVDQPGALVVAVGRAIPVAFSVGEQAPASSQNLVVPVVGAVVHAVHGAISVRVFVHLAAAALPREDFVCVRRAPVVASMAPSRRGSAIGDWSGLPGWADAPPDPPAHGFGGHLKEPLANGK